MWSSLVKSNNYIFLSFCVCLMQSFFCRRMWWSSQRSVDWAVQVATVQLSLHCAPQRIWRVTSWKHKQRLLPSRWETDRTKLDTSGKTATIDISKSLFLNNMHFGHLLPYHRDLWVEMILEEIGSMVRSPLSLLGRLFKFALIMWTSVSVTPELNQKHLC